jgi:hypothetical protein
MRLRVGQCAQRPVINLQGNSTQPGVITLRFTCTVGGTAASSADPGQPPFPISGLSASPKTSCREDIQDIQEMEKAASIEGGDHRQRNGG